ncbi:hypothetical protein SASPL_152148 [Salvia splendens]|uniref:Pentatricopeptide repeat-containing protein n=1 Tax=Salvia splendens TaxID=180675 RepID=A0A8X8Z022_SALSN|nr:hypothetical protein SASPL_152148 [Salvia splendens]
MLDAGIEPNAFTLSALIKACSATNGLRLGKSLRGAVVRCGFGGNEVISAALIDMHGRNGESSASRQLFDEMPEPDSVCCTSMISALTRSDLYLEALCMFNLMHRKFGFMPDCFTFGSALTALGNLERLKQGREIHALAATGGFVADVFVGSSLVDMYAKCGVLEDSRRVLDGMPLKNSVSWCALLGGYCRKGKFGVVVNVFRGIDKDLYSFGTVLRACAIWPLRSWGRREGVKPDNISFIEVLFACSHSGLVGEGRRCFVSICNDYGMKPEIEHYSCMVDLLGRAGEIEEAEGLIMESEFGSDPMLWTALLGACASATSPGVAERIAKKVIRLKPDCHQSYVHLANVYKSVGRWQESHEIWKQMKERGVKKLPGMSWIGRTRSSSNPSIYALTFFV